MALKFTTKNSDIIARTDQFFRLVGIGTDKQLQALVTKDIDLHATNSYGYTPLHLAAIYGHTATVKTLLQAGANIHATDNEGNTPLHFAAYNGYTATVKTLLQAGANIHATNHDGYTPLHFAARDGRTATVKTLLQAGANIHATNNIGYTPLHFAAYNGQTATMKRLQAHQDYWEGVLHRKDFSSIQTIQQVLCLASVIQVENKNNPSLQELFDKYLTGSDFTHLHSATKLNLKEARQISLNKKGVEL
jgi:ankyrin repeat protein